MSTAENENKVCRNCFRFIEDGVVVDEHGGKHPYGFVNPTSCYSAATDPIRSKGGVQGNRMCTDESKFLPRDF